MKRRILTIFCLGLISISIAGCSAISNSNTSTRHRKKIIIATTFAAYDWTKNIIKGSGNVDVIYPINNKIDIHSYHRTSNDVETYRSADLIIGLDNKSEDWLKYTGSAGIIFLMDYVDKMEVPQELSEDEDTAEPIYDEHIWLSLVNAKKCINAIQNAVIGIDSINKDLYSLNTLDYIKDLNALNQRYENTVDSSKNRTLIFADRYPFRYMARDYGLTCYSAFPGCSTDVTVSVDALEDLGQRLQASNLKNVCVITENDEVAQIVIDSSGNNDIGIVMFESMQAISNKEAKDLSYLSIMEDNLSSLEKGLELRQADRPEDFGDPWVVFVGSNGDTILQTKVWELEDGYYYENYTTSQGFAGLYELYSDAGTVATKEELLNIINEREETTFLYHDNMYKTGVFISDAWEDKGE